MKELILKINGPIQVLLAQMYTTGQYSKQMFVTDENKYYSLMADLKSLIEERYLSVSRKGKKINVKILKRGQVEIISI